MTTHDGGQNHVTPDESQMKILKNLKEGKSFEMGFIHTDSAVRAMFQCILNGWVDRNRLTDLGHSLVPGPVRAMRFEITNLGPDK